MDKKQLRKIYLSLRDKQNKNDSILVFEKLINSKEYKNAKIIFCYVSIGSEIDTRKFIKHALADNKIILIPYCLTQKREMTACRIYDLYKDTKIGTYNILEPADNSEFDKNLIDLSIVPGIAFDKHGNRLGYGAGYYDKFLANINSYKIGLSYDSLLIDSLPSFHHDVKMDKILTPGKEIIINEC